MSRNGKVKSDHLTVDAGPPDSVFVYCVEGTPPGNVTPNISPVTVSKAPNNSPRSPDRYINIRIKKKSNSLLLYAITNSLYFKQNLTKQYSSFPATFNN